ncbi:WXG100 family type VII secretion target [Lentzea aerocolonigenes]|uniref:WXG100 family type VII secretion target n=1 Tax=Lentzea aerocolonigenes TaxID=68170 RepID=UPI0004C3F6AF|nr:hypothetical protein [Lentzea aerocolonigenes]MCP2248876.1 hypothetical protein [Lentzea aerocolonigenes]
MEQPTWQEVKALLDNPNIPFEERKELALRYFDRAEDEDMPGLSEDEANKVVEEYDKKFSLGDWDRTWADDEDDNFQDSLDAARASAKADKEKNGDTAAEKSAVDAGKQQLRDQAKGGPYSAGVAKSDDIIDKGNAALKMFDRFLPKYLEACGIAGKGNGDFTHDAVIKLWDEQRGILFSKLEAEIQEWATARSAITDAAGKMQTDMNGLYSHWTGKASDKSSDFFGKFQAQVRVVTDSLTGSEQAVGMACSKVAEAVRVKTQWLLDNYKERICERTPQEVDVIVRVARAGRGASDEDIQTIAAFLPTQQGQQSVADMVGDDNCDLNDETKDYAARQAVEWCKIFCDTFRGILDAFKTTCENTKKAVDEHWANMNKFLNERDEDPFKVLGQTQPTGNGKGGDNGKGTGGGSGTGGGGGTGSGGGGSGSGGGGGGGMPEIPKPENPLDKNGDGKPDLPGDTDGDGKIDDLDGDGKPDDKNGDGKPDQPKPEEKLESVTVKAGDNTIKVTEPDSNGHVKMTIDTPKGEPKTYDLDFSKNPEAAKALMGQNGTQAVTAMANQLTGTATQGSQAPGAPGGNTPAPGGGAPGGAGTGAPGSESNPIPVEVGADGKIHIEQDGVNFTAEVDSKTGEINLTADNGDGTPDQIGVGFGEDENPAAGGTDKAGAGGMTGDLRLDEPLTLPEQDFPRPAEGEFQPMPAPAQGEFQTMPAPAQGEFQTMPAQAEQVWSPPGQDGPNVAERFQESVGRSYIEDNGIMPNAGEPKIAAASDSTTTSGVSFTGAGGSSGGESVLGGSSPADSAWSTPSQSDNGGAFDTNASEAGQAGSANLPSMQDAHGQPTSGAATGGMMGGGMMGGGGGMMGGGAGGQQGGDTERGASQWRTTGSLFDDDNNPLTRVAGVLGEDSRA